LKKAWQCSMIGGMGKKFKVSEVKSPHVEVKKSGLPPFLKFGIPTLVLLILIVAGAFAYQFYTFKKQVKEPVALASEPKELINQVGQLIELPLNEEPTIATVSDVNKLKDQQFFTNAQNGDKVLIYQKAKKAILFRPATKKIVDVGPVNIDQPQASASATTSGTPTPSTTAQNTPAVKVALYNGTQRSGLTRSAETKLKDGYKTASILERTNAENNYKETLIIDVTGKKKSQAADLAKIVGGKVAPFPNGEASTSAEILIILGDNYKSD
jgi:hypothetical protein